MKIINKISVGKAIIAVSALVLTIFIGVASSCSTPIYKTRSSVFQLHPIEHTLFRFASIKGYPSPPESHSASILSFEDEQDFVNISCKIREASLYVNAFFVNPFYRLPTINAP
ncbi:MAG: hypothetical protein QM734_05225 [Cyclobacteriaceae bacterium]